MKHFSRNGNGGGISVIHVNHPHRKGIKTYNSGDSVFWEKNYYNTEGQNPKQIEKFLGQSIENDYNQLIVDITHEKPIHSLDVKLKIFKWIFYSKLRSPVWRNHLIQKFDEAQNINSESRKLHMSFFTDPNLFKFFTNKYSEELPIKKWRILICPEDNGWITTDSPGIMINLKEFAKAPNDYFPNALWNKIRHDSAFYFPLTSNYCLELWPYDEHDDVERNIGTDSISYIKSSEDMYKQINYWTMHSASKILISKNETDLLFYKKLLNQ